MTMKNLKRSFLAVLLVVLIAAMALFAVGCSENENIGGVDSTTTSQHPQTEAKDVKYMGYGEHVFELTVTDHNGSESYFHIHTDKETVGEALMELGLLEGDEGPYGLYVKTVNGITADFDKDGKYWAFYIDGEYATSGVDTTKIEEGKSYELKVE